MNKTHIDSELYEILHFTPEPSPEVQSKIDNAYEQISNGKIQIHQKRKIHGIIYPGAAAAIIILLGFLGFSNPALAGKIPFIGRIFRTVENSVGYSGNYSDYATTITAPDTNAYSQTSGDITITLSEVICTDMALYISLGIYSEEGFPETLNLKKSMENYSLSYNFLYPMCSNSFDFLSNEGLPAPDMIEGDYADSHTFLGIMRLDMDRIRDIAGLDTLPSEFTYSISINGLWGILNEPKEYQTTHEITGETTTIQGSKRKHYEGIWNFTIPVTLDQSGTQVKEIMETNEDGIGISMVTKTRYEIKAELILPDALLEEKDPWAYMVAITDTDGKMLDSQGNVVEIYSLYGRNTDTVHIYVVDHTDFMEGRLGNTQALEENAYFKTTVTW